MLMIRDVNMTKKIVNIEDPSLTLTERQHNEKFKARTVDLSGLLPAQKLGYRVVHVDPGYRAWPFHSHRVNEEMFFILEGQGLVRIGEESFSITKGDVICAPAGGTEHAHQILNNSDNTLSYLCISTMEAPDVMEYPDSGKFGVFVGTAPGGPSEERTFSFFGRESSAVSYWDDE